MDFSSTLSKSNGKKICKNLHTVWLLSLMTLYLSHVVWYVLALAILEVVQNDTRVVNAGNEGFVADIYLSEIDTNFRSCEVL